MPKAESIRSALAGTESSSPYEPADEGEYELHVDGAEAEEARTSDNGSLVPVRVRVQFSFRDGNGQAYKVWHSFYIDFERKLGFLKRFYRLATGNDLGKDAVGASEIEVAKLIANAVGDANMVGTIGVRKRRDSNDEENYLKRLAE